MMKAIASFDLKLSEIFKDMYDRSIDYGGHPNPHGMIGSMDIRKDVEEQLTGMTTFALAPNCGAAIWIGTERQSGWESGVAALA